MERFVRIAAASLLVVALAGSVGCTRVRLEDTGDVRVDTESIARGQAESALVKLQMGAGELRLQGEDLGGDAVAAEFTYGPEKIRPEVESDNDGDRVEFDVRQPDGRGFNLGSNSYRNEWDVSIDESLPVGLIVQLGAGDADFDLRGVELVDLDIEMGAGELTLDLSGERSRDLEGRIQAGVGSLRVVLPEEVGVRVSGADGGLGEWDYSGFTRDGDYLVNDAYEDAEVRIELDIERGVGEVELELAD